MSPVASYVVQTVVTLLGVAALAVVILYGARRAGVGRAAGPLEIVGRLPLDGRRTVFLVRVGAAIYVVGSSDAGLVKLGETTEAALFPESSGTLGGAARTESVEKHDAV